VTYREQTFAERCYCDAPATLSCAVCHRPRCADHAGPDHMCHRCATAMQLEMRGRGGTRWIFGVTSGVSVALGALIAHVPMTGMIFGLVTAAATFVATPPIQRRRLKRELGPRLATSVGEVEPQVDYDALRFPTASTSRYGGYPQR
jgi:hypothetical protein